MAYTKTRGTCCAPPASQKPKTIVGLDRLNLRDADGRLSFKCERSDLPQNRGAITTRTSAKILL